LLPSSRNQIVDRAFQIGLIDAGPDILLQTGDELIGQVNA
jgi:hypothetical protein